MPHLSPTTLTADEQRLIDPRRENASPRVRQSEIDQTASVVLEGASPETRPFIDNNLRELAGEKRRHQERLDELEVIDLPSIDADAVVRQGRRPP